MAADPATRYALDVVRWASGSGGGRMAADLVVAQCGRHLRDLESGRYDWRPDLGRRAAERIAMMKVEDRVRGGVRPFVLLPWQAFVVYSIFGWLAKKGDRMGRLPGTRRYRRAFIITGRGSGKSSLAAAIGAVCVIDDGWVGEDGLWVPETNPPGYVTGSTEDQARKVGVAILQKILAGTDLAVAAGVEWSGGKLLPRRMYSLVSRGFLEAVGTRTSGAGKGGLDVHYLQGEELSEWAKLDQFELLESGTRGRVQPLTLMLTNAAQMPQGPAWDERIRAKTAVEGSGDDSLFGYIAELTEADIPSARTVWYPPPRLWPLANPSIGVTMRKDYIKGRIAKAETGSDHDRSEVLRLNFAMWPGLGGVLVDREDWLACEQAELDVPEDADLFIGIDLGSRFDLAALTELWVKGEMAWARVHQFTGAERLRERDRYSSGELVQWAARGYIETSPGPSLDFGVVASRLKGLLAQRPEARVCMDPWNQNQFITAAEGEGLELRDETDRRGRGHIVYTHPQGLAPAPRNRLQLWMHGSIDQFRTRVATRRIAVQLSPVLRWNLICAELSGDRDALKFEKRWHGLRSRGADDGVVSLVMASGLAAFGTGRKSRWSDPDYNPY